MRGAGATRLTVMAAGLLGTLALLIGPRSAVPAPGARPTMAASIQPTLHVIPFPNTPDASPRSRIIFSALAPSDFSHLPSVAGSSSGPHTGRLIALPDGAGTTFAPDRSFTPGETVRVRAHLTSRQAGTASGDPGATSLAFSFTVASPPTGSAAATENHPGATGHPSAVRASGSSSPVFRSDPQLNAPPVSVSTGPAPGTRDIFVSPAGDPRGMMILNPRGQLLWFHPLRTLVPANLEVQRYRDQPVLTWWQGTFSGGHGTGGEDVILNRSYHRVATVHPGWGYSSDQHEFQITPQGTALLDAYAIVKANLSSVGGPADGALADCVIQELDIRTGAVLWEWHAWGHVPLAESYLHPPSSGFHDAFHLNSIQQLPDQRLLVSFRNTSAVYELDERTGRVIWTLGGKRSSFAMGRGSNFMWQHDAHLYAHGLLTLFDDADPNQEDQSSAEELRIDTRRHRASLVRRYRHSPPLLANTQGSAQLLSDHDVFVGWGNEPYLSEYTPAGRQVFNASLALTHASYRAYRFPWTGHPTTAPALAVSRSAKGEAWLHVSWNGATQVDRWRVLGGPDARHLTVRRTKRWSGFETAIALPHAPAFLAAQALDTHGHVLGRSPTLARPSRHARTASPPPALHVVPFPNTPDASPRSQIIFSSLRPGDLASPPAVVGSSSGPHTGTVSKLPDQAGTAFTPGQPFTPGERVTVTAILRSAHAGTASGDPGAHSLRFSFGVGITPPGQATTAHPSTGASPARSGPLSSARRFDPPPVHVSTGPAPGRKDIFLSPHVSDPRSGLQSGVMILNARGRLTWFRPVPTGAAYNLEVQRYHGQRVLTWWQGILQRHSTTVGGQDVILNSSYRPVAVLHAAYGYSSDLHEFQITPQGTALIDAYVPVRVDLRHVGGPRDGWLDDCVIQALDIKTGRILWEWHALGHVPLNATHARRTNGKPYLYFHLNSIRQLPGQRLLVSSRNTWSVYLIDERTGKLLWTLGGRYSNFKMGPGAGFEWQHDAHLNGHGLLTLFDDGDPSEEAQSSAKELRIDSRARTVSLVRRFRHSPPLLATSQGSAELLYDRDMFVGWGNEPDFSEYTPGGRQLFDATLPLGVNTYRAYRFAWTGHPLTRPALAVSRSAAGTALLHVSWNGATEVARWRVLGGSDSHHLTTVKVRPWSGFETSIALPSAPRYVAVQALDTHGHTLGRSFTVAARSG